ncbi:hypothetical protein D3C85_1021160 [compost metagenome]
MVEGTVAARTDDIPAVDLCSETLDRIFDPCVPGLHALGSRASMLGRQILEAETLAGPDSKTSKLRTNRHFVRGSRAELQSKIQILEKVSRCEFFVDLRKVDCWRCGRRRLLEIR